MPATGQMLRFTQWYSQRGQNPRLQPDEEMWGLALGGDSFEPLLGHKPTDSENTDSWAFDDQDHFEIVPVEEWPGEICAIMAARALLND